MDDPNYVNLLSSLLPNAFYEAQNVPQSTADGTSPQAPCWIGGITPESNGEWRRTWKGKEKRNKFKLPSEILTLRHNKFISNQHAFASLHN